MHNSAGLKSKDELVEIFHTCGISEDARPGDVSLEEWGKLYQLVMQ